MHAVNAVVVLDVGVGFGPFDEAGDIVRADDEEGRAGLGALPGEVEALDALLVRPPRAGHVHVLRVRVGPTEPGGARPRLSVHLPPGKVEPSDEPTLGPPFMRLGQGGVHEDQAELAGRPERRLPETVGSTGAAHRLLAVELPTHDRGETSGFVVVARQPGGVVVVDTEQDQTIPVVHVAQAGRDHAPDLLVLLRGRLVVGQQIVPANLVPKSGQSLAREFVQGVPDPDRLGEIEPFVEAVLGRFPGQDADVGLEGEGRRVPELAPTVGVSRTVVPGDRKSGQGVGGAGVNRAQVRAERFGDLVDRLLARSRTARDPGGDGSSCHPDPLSEIRLTHARLLQLAGEPGTEVHAGVQTSSLLSFGRTP
ncbi:hypothetical protein SFIMM107S_02511 [Streptomyces griseus]